MKTSEKLTVLGVITAILLSFAVAMLGTSDLDTRSRAVEAYPSVSPTIVITPIPTQALMIIENFGSETGLTCTDLCKRSLRRCTDTGMDLDAKNGQLLLYRTKKLWPFNDGYWYCKSYYNGSCDTPIRTKNETCWNSNRTYEWPLQYTVCRCEP